MLAFLFPGVGTTELLVIGVVAVVLFGSRLPTVARSFGRSMTEFRRGMSDLQTEFKDAMREADRASTTAEQTARTPQETQPRLPAAASPADVSHDDSLADTAYDADLPIDEPDADPADEAVDRRETSGAADA